MPIPQDLFYLTAELRNRLTVVNALVEDQAEFLSPLVRQELILANEYIKKIETYNHLTNV